MKKFLLIWVLLNLALSPVASAFSLPMPYMVDSETEEHCMGHESEVDEPQDMGMECCDSEYDQNQCCDHCVTAVSGLLNTNLSLALNSLTDLTITFIQPILPETHSLPYKPPQA